ncbi:MAG TPA: DUF86 domain-containing protein [Chitinophagales bacterium]|nr:DUF86 domain-containing protein [Chitinophagales bacterium]MBP6155205.1 DUF86 domain-containing protein [Chitinophagales bacterium]HQV78002.1 DUF86 domain-containing protein [Chitinophagales bacterium]HQW78724.1 DUF86 domain-containing protein [Chitinophagales bacterium]
MLQSIEKVFYFTNEFNTAEEYFKNRKQETYLASLALITNIGEQSNKLSDDFKFKINSINWKQIKGLRNFLVHNYEGVDYIIIFDTIKNDLPILKIQLENYLKVEISSNRINKDIFVEFVLNNPFYDFIDFKNII